MPRLPSVDDVTRLPVQVGRGVAQYSGAELQGQSVRAIGQEITQVADQELARLDELRVEEAVNKLREKDTELTIGEKGYVRVKGDAALSKPLIDTYGEQYKRAAADIGTGLTARQRAKFDAAANRGRQQFQAGVLRHTLGEADKRDDEVYKAGIVSIQDKASKYAAAGLPTDQLQQELDAVLARRLARDGIDPSTPDGAKIAGAIRLQEHGKVHSAIIESYIQGDKITEATEYLKANEKNLTADQYKAVNARLKPLNDIAVGDTLGVEAFNLLRGGKTEVDVALFLSEKTKGNATAARAAENKFKDLSLAAERDERQITGTYIKDVLQNPGNANAVIKKVYADPALANDPARQARIVTQIQTLQDQERNRRFSQFQQGRAYADAADNPRRTLAEQRRADLALGKLLDDPTIYAKSEEELYSYTDTLGPKGVRELITYVRRNKVEATNFTLDKDILNDVATQVAGEGKDKAADRLAYKGFVARKLNEWQTNNPGKKPTAAEEEKIIRSGALQYKKEGTLWGWNETPAYKADPEAVHPNFVAKYPKLSSGEVSKLWQNPPSDFTTNLKNAVAKRGGTISADGIRAAWQAEQSKGVQ